MKPSNLEQANDLVLSRIAQVPEGSILGFLPLSQSEEDAVLDLVKNALGDLENLTSIFALLLSKPAATAYAVAVTPSRSLTTGGNFWPALEEGLNLYLDTSQRKDFSRCFRAICRRLGLLDGTIDGAGWKYAAPFIFQAGILHYWKDALAQALRSTLRVTPAPDLENEEAMSRFVTDLSGRLYNQPILSRILETPIGPLLVRRLIVAYLQNDDSVLPPHLREPLRESFKTAGRGVVLRSPYLSYNLAFDQLELVLPPQSNRIATPDTAWLVGKRRYAARSETRLLLDDLPKRRLHVELQNMAGNFEDQSFQVDTRLNSEVPFRVFREDTLRERRSDAGSSSSIPPGIYLVVMARDVHAGEDEPGVEERNGFRVLRNVELRPGDEPVELHRSDEHWSLECALQTGVFIDKNRSSTAPLDGGELLHYGPDIGLVAYFPTVEEDQSEFTLSVCCKEQALEHSATLRDEGSRNQVYVFTENIKEPLAEALAQLSPGIHRIQVAISHSSRRVEHAFWYWRGLDIVSEAMGFQCSAPPENVDLHKSRGIERNSQGNLAFEEEYHAPSIRLALTSPVESLIMPRAGIQALLLAPGDDWEEELSADEPVTVLKGDRRVVRFRSGGFQRWEIQCGSKSIITLDRNRSSFLISLAGLAQTFGGSGRVSAKREDGREVPLLVFTKPLTATSPTLRRDHGKGIEEWSFSLPTEDLSDLGVQITDLSTRADAPAGEVQTVASASDDFARPNLELTTGLTLKVGKSEQKGASFVDAVLSAKSEDMTGRFLLLDFLRRSEAGESWLPLRCAETHGYSSIRFVLKGKPLPEENATWWGILHDARRGENIQKSQTLLAEALDSIQLEDLQATLTSCRRLLGWKYPTEIWNQGARFLQDLPVYLGRHCFNASSESGAIWWNQAVAELSDYGENRETPVVRQFLFGSQPASLRTSINSVKPGTSRQFSTLIGRSLNLAAAIQTAGGLLPFIPKAYHNKTVWHEAFHSFQRFNEVSLGKSETFGRFTLKEFLTGLYEGTEQLAESFPRVRAEALLSPEHLLVAVRGLNRRCRALESASNTDGDHPLAAIPQLVQKLHQRLPMTMPPISKKLGIDGQFRNAYEPDHFVYWWSPPALENRWAQKVADLIWGLAGVVRMGANGRISTNQTDQWFGDLLHATNARDIQNRTCILLSLAPELFSFYVALFDLANSQQS